MLKGTMDNINNLHLLVVYNSVGPSVCLNKSDITTDPGRP